MTRSEPDKTATSDVSVRNVIIRTIRPEAQAFIAERWQTRPMQAGDVIYEAGQRFTHAVFPHTGVISYTPGGDSDHKFQKASIGNEGFVGFAYVMGGTAPVNRIVVQVPGVASWLTVADLDEAMERFACVREAMLLYSKALIVQLMETVYCNTQHTAEQRICRWLLHAHDRMDAQDFRLTQDALASAMGLRRATVSQVCSAVMRTGAISYVRGRVSVLDRHKLEAHACDCYQRIVAAGISKQER